MKRLSLLMLATVLMSLTAGAVPVKPGLWKTLTLADGTTEAQLEGIGVFCHELGHALGLPDWYCTNKKYKEDDAFGKWSIMDVGCYEGNSWAPVGYTAYERSFMGWQDIPTLQEKTLMQLTNPQGDKPAILIANPNDNKEYFILETRQPSTWYPNYQGTGLTPTARLMTTVGTTCRADCWKTLPQRKAFTSTTARRSSRNKEAGGIIQIENLWRILKVY